LAIFRYIDVHFAIRGPVRLLLQASHPRPAACSFGEVDSWGERREEDVEEKLDPPIGDSECGTEIPVIGISRTVTRYAQNNPCRQYCVDWPESLGFGGCRLKSAAWLLTAPEGLWASVDFSAWLSGHFAKLIRL
jgi:hypothetical protein